MSKTCDARRRISLALMLMSGSIACDPPWMIGVAATTENPPHEACVAQALQLPGISSVVRHADVRRDDGHVVSFIERWNYVATIDEEREVVDGHVELRRAPFATTTRVEVSLVGLHKPRFPQDTAVLAKRIYARVQHHCEGLPENAEEIVCLRCEP